RGSLAFFWKGHGVQSPWLAISQTYLSALFSCQRPDGHNQSRYELEAFNIKV
ncbi:transposase, partial [Clostridioides difficile]|nr:transposase [Clostridioides difficile]MDB0417300.1 transposase [Clostridioides difficile]MDB3569439.1 transposase [Clostridioides difficile]